MHKNYKVLRFAILSGLLMVFMLIAAWQGNAVKIGNPLHGKTICLDPGHGATADSDTFRIGPSGEREEWINLRVAHLLKEMLESKGAKVVMTRTADTHVELAQRAEIAKKARADVFLSIHHNATADSAVNFPIIYFHGQKSENEASVLLGSLLARSFKKHLFGGETTISLVSDLTIYPGSGTAVLRHSYGIPSVIGEASFFSNPTEEQRLKQPAYNKQEALAYLESLEAYFSSEIPEIKAKNSLVSIPLFDAYKAAGRMSEVAKGWLTYFEQGKELMQTGGEEELKKAYELFTLSAKAFVDSPVAADCHAYRALIYEIRGENEKAKIERLRVSEHYVKIE